MFSLFFFPSCPRYFRLSIYSKTFLSALPWSEKFIHLSLLTLADNCMPLKELQQELGVPWSKVKFGPCNQSYLLHWTIMTLCTGKHLQWGRLISMKSYISKCRVISTFSFYHAQSYLLFSYWAYSELYWCVVTVAYQNIRISRSVDHLACFFF